ncbi:DgyrCDS9402 [Dimorphilus gyrociliatus]|uniref:DgyrCDS9402 n=1 Tax=Dimorphilus gyrociliatus TaxID=2664684 RepID=A0A7I8VX91_9ANNE|nr:DgyrCDS9402 [Dimorphilus gyrociliatus]
MDAKAESKKTEKKKAVVDDVKEKYESGEEKKREKIMREPKKLDNNWEEKNAEPSSPLKDMNLPDAELVLLEAASKHKDKTIYQNGKSANKTAQEPVNRRVVEKVAPPAIAQNVRKMFETGEIPDVHEVRKTKIDLRAKDGGVFENEPCVRNDVIRGNDTSMDELKSLEKGTAKTLKNKWMNISTEEKESKEKKKKDPIKLFNESECTPIVAENQPVVRDDVTKSDYVPDNLDFERGKIKNLGNYFKEAAQEQNTTKTAVKNGPIRIEKSHEPTVHENQPVKREDVFREDYSQDDREVLEKGKAKTLAKTFLESQKDNKGERKQPIVIDKAAGPTVLENQPEFRDDVVREDCSDLEELRKISSEKGKIKNMASSFISRKDQEKPQLTRPTPRLRDHWLESDGQQTTDGPPTQLVRFTPPRELTPPPLRNEAVLQSYGQITLSSKASSPPVADVAPTITSSNHLSMNNV